MLRTVQSPSGDCHPGASTIPLISKNFYLHRLQLSVNIRKISE
jgi:hypothetical protein